MDKEKLIDKIKNLQGLTNDEKADLLGLLRSFKKYGLVWEEKLEDVYLGNPMRHDEKYLLINQGFAGKQRLMPFFNRQNNDDLILAIQTAGVVRGRNGFRKDKDY